MATIYRRKNKQGKYSYYFNISINGNRIRRFAGYSKEAAKLNLKKLEYNLIFKEGDRDSSKSFEDALDSFKHYIQTTEITYRQVKTVYSKISWFKDYCLFKGLVDLKDIKSGHAIIYIANRSQTKVQSKYHSSKDRIVQKISSVTLNREIGFLKRFFNYCIDMEWIQTSPFRAVKPFKIKPKKERYYFSENEINLIMKNASKFNDFYTFLLYTGLRPTDAFKLRKKHINGSYIALKMNKTGDYLNIPISDQIIRLIRPRINQEYIFPEVQSDRQRRNALRNIQRLFNSEFIRSNNISLHTFRHTYAHRMLNRGVPKEVLQTFLGHRSIKTTEIYANWVRKEELAKWVK